MLHALPKCTRLGWRPGCTHGTPRFLPPRLIRQFASHPHEEVLPRYGLFGSRHQFIRIFQMVDTTRKLLRQQKNEEAVEYFKSQISSIHRTSRSYAYDRGISEFLAYRCFSDAILLHRHMIAEGISVYIGLRAKMIFCSSIVKAPHEQKKEFAFIFYHVSHVLSLPSYSERALCGLLDVMKHHPLVDSHFASKLIDGYVSSRSPEYELNLSTINKLIRFYVQVGRIDTAESLVESYHRPSRGRRRTRNPGAYTTLISKLSNCGSLSTTHLDSLLEKMERSRISVDLPLFNTLVQVAVRKKNFHQAFTIYETILRAGMVPDSFAFGSLFNGLHHIWASNGLGVRGSSQPPNAPTPRQLFRQMLESHIQADQVADRHTCPVVRVSTLNVALRLFMLRMDYASAFVTLQTFRVLDLKPNARTYRFVFVNLLAHLKPGFEVETQSYRRRVGWAFNFLNGNTRLADTPPDEDIRPEVARALLDFAVGSTRFRVPPIAAILGDEVVPPKEGGWDIEPLERLVAKAILAGMNSKAASDAQVQCALREKLAPFFHELVPDELWRGRWLRRPLVRRRLYH